MRNRKTQKRPNAIFIVGHPRSGTTLLTSLLGKNSKIQAAPETNFYNSSRYGLRLAGVRKSSKLSMVIEGTRLEDLDLGGATLQELGISSPRATERDIISALLYEYAKTRGKEVILEKSPLHIRHIDEIIRDFPDAKIIWIIRDGRACVSSLLKASFASNNWKWLCWQWIVSIRFGNMFLEKYTEWIQTVTYEELVANPRVTLEKIHDFLEIRFEENQLSLVDVPGIIQPYEIEWKSKVLSEIDPSGVANWKSTLTVKDIGNIERLLGTLNAHLGYPMLTEKHQRPLGQEILSYLLSKRYFLYLLRACFSGLKRFKLLQP
ncbi:MAG: sulfotransferase [Alphaproteobacteria bacterium]|nr:MAG: sulfotransferase [Alphaproteobacteria bacterium]